MRFTGKGTTEKYLREIFIKNLVWKWQSYFTVLFVHILVLYFINIIVILSRERFRYNLHMRLILVSCILRKREKLSTADKKTGSGKQPMVCSRESHTHATSIAEYIGTVVFSVFLLPYRINGHPVVFTSSHLS